MKKPTTLNKKSILFFIFLLIISTSSVNGQRPFVTVWDVGNSREIEYYSFGTGSYSFVKVDDEFVKGQGNFNSDFYNLTTIKFPAKGIYRVSIVPSTKFGFKVSPTKPIIELSQWGDIDWNEDISGMFIGCPKLKFTATDIPDFKNVKDMSYMFSLCTAENIPGIENWDVGSVVNMSHMFDATSKFNQPIGSWNTSQVKNMSYMFANTNSIHSNGDGTSYITGFNQNIENWNTSNVEDMSFMFYYALNFNQPLENWNVSNVMSMDLMFNNAINFNQTLNDWNTGNVLSMAYMFQNATKFNQPIEKWNVSNVSNMSGILSDAKDFNQSLGSWNLKNLSSNFGKDVGLDNTKIDCENYKKTLMGWSQNPNNLTDIFCFAKGIKYGDNGRVYRNLLLSKGWSFENDSYNWYCNELGLSETILKDVIIYPNPFKSEFKVKISKSLLANLDVQIFSMEGKLVYLKSFQPSEEIKITLSESLNSGIYNIVISYGNTSKSFKVIKK